jgi:quercetin dioxygenase-like cupin family protein
VDPRIKVDNDRVRILVATDRPHDRTPLHQHQLNRVMIYLDDAGQDIAHPDGSVEHLHWKANDVAWSPAGGPHTSENISAHDLRIVEVELKKPGPETAPARDRKLDPLVIDVAHNKLLFENAQVRVFRSTREAGGREEWHEHTGAGRAVVMLTALEGRVESADGTTTPMRGVRGDAVWSDGAVKHRGSNAGRQPSDLVLVEVK